MSNGVRIGSFLALFSCILLADASGQSPSNTVVVRAQSSVFQVVAEQCASGAPLFSTGFAVSVNNDVHFITDLHGVAGCRKWMIQYANNTYDVSVGKVLKKADLAELVPLGTLNIPPLSLNTNRPTGGQDLEAIGYGSTPTINPSHAQVRKGGGSTIASLIESPNTTQALTNQGFPDLGADIINIDSPLTPGDSGAPLIDESGLVVGIANGNLLQGTLPYSWAFPSDNISSLLRSHETCPSNATTSGVLISAERQDAATGKTFQCGAATFSYRGTASISRILDTADPFANSNINLVIQLANINAAPIPLDTKYDVYADSATGADFAVPSDYALSASGQDCIATDPNNELVMRISSDTTSSFADTGPLSLAFAKRMEVPPQIPLVNPQYTTPAFERPADHMQIQRFAFVYGILGQLNRPNQGYLTLAWRANTLLEVSTRDIADTRLPMKSNPFVPVVAVYAASFSKN